MAKLMADVGITDIKQFGKIPVYEKAESKLGFQGQVAQQDADGNYYIMAPGGVDSEGYPYNSRQNVDPSQLKPIYGKTISTPEGETVTSTFQPLDPSQLVMKDGVATYKDRDSFGNKETGQLINRGSGRWEGQGGDDLFSGTGAGKGNTGYRVKFNDDGTPIFYTTQGSSSDLGQIAPLLSIASFIPGLQPFAMAANAAIAAHQGDPLGALAGVAGLGGFTDVANAARMGKALQSGDPLAIALSGANFGGITDVGGVNLKDISKTIGAVKAIESGDPLALLRYGMGALPKDDSLTSSIGPGNMEEFKENLIPGYFQPGGEGYIAKEVTNPLGPTEEFNPDETDWASMYKTVGGEGVDESNLSKLSPEERARYEALNAGASKEADAQILPAQEEPPAQEIVNPVTVEQTPNVDSIINSLEPYKQPTLNELVADVQPKIEAVAPPQPIEPVIQEPAVVNNIAPVVQAPAIVEPVSPSMPSPDEDFAPTFPTDNAMGLPSLGNTAPAPPITNFLPPTNTEPTQPASNELVGLINNTGTDTLGTNTTNAAEPAVGTGTTMDDIDYRQIFGDYGINIADEIANAGTSGNASSIFSGDGGLDLSELSSGVSDDGTTGDIQDTINSLTSGQNNQGYYDEITGEFVQNELGGLLNPLEGSSGDNSQGYYNEITGEFVQNPLGGLSGPLDNDVGNLDPDSKWEYSLKKPGVWVNDEGKEIDLSYLPNTQKTMTGAEIMKRAGALAGSGGKPSTSTAKAAAKPGTSPGTNNTQMLMALMAMMAMMNSRGSGGSSAASSIPALSANRSQLPYAPTGRPGAGGQNYFSPTTFTPKAAGGGLMGLAAGGMSNLGGYSDGGRLLKGPGDGVSDSIPATIGGKQPARLATGEFVVPARIVSELGNGSTEAGAKKLYAMMDRVQKARRKTKNVAADTKAHKYLPA
jgi:hypothetical protein